MLVHQEELTKSLEEIDRHTLLSIDTETTGLDRKDKPFAVIIATADKEYYFDERCTGKFFDRLNDLAPKAWVLQNAKFDMKMLGRMGVELKGKHFDVACGSRILRNDPIKHSLDAQAERYLGVRKSDEVKKYIKQHDLFEVRHDFFGVEYKQPQFDKVPIDIMHEYACLDARLTYDLHTYYQAQMTTDQMNLYHMEADLTPVCLQMEEHGVLLDKDYTLEAMYHEANEADTAKERYTSYASTPFVNSAKSIQKSLSVTLPTTEAGNPSLDDDVVDWVIANGSPLDKVIAETVRQIRTYDKRVSTYYKPYLNLCDSGSIIHPTMWQAGTRTGRFSYSDPNLQNIPKEEDSTDKYVVRGCFKPRHGRVYVSFDYSQMEYMLMAAYANEEHLITAVMGGADFHQVTADMVNISRKQAKTLNFALLYGAGGDQVASMLNTSKPQADQLKFKYFSKLSRIENFIDRVINTGKSRGYVETWTKRRMYAEKEFCYALPNHLIQGGGADVVKKAMIEINRQYPHIPMVLQVHDQLVFEMTALGTMLIPEIKRIMESVFPPMNGLTLRVDVSISTGSLAERDMIKQ